MTTNQIDGIMFAIAGFFLFAQQWQINRMRKSNERLAFMHSEDDAVFAELKSIIREDRENFLKVDAFGMTRDELAAYQKQAKESGMYGAWPDDPCEAVKAILVEWHAMRRKMMDAEARANAAEWRSAQYESLQAVNTEFNDIVAGVRDRLSTSPDSPFGIYTGRFPTFAKLCLFLVDRSLAPGAPPESLSKLDQDVAKGLKGAF